MLQGQDFEEKLRQIVGFEVNDIDLYNLAFTHKSAGITSAQPIKSYDRLEFIGDAVINLVVALYLFWKYPDQPEGFMTRLRTKLVSGKCLCDIAKRLQLHQMIRMNMKAINNGWNCNDRILEDVFEALVAAITLDQGLLTAQIFVLQCITNFVCMDSIEDEDNYKDILMRHTQAEGIALPIYHAHESFEFGRRQYEVTVYCQHSSSEKAPLGFGVAFTKKKAEQEAANHALQTIRGISSWKAHPPCKLPQSA